jgi:hypothetical protein
MMEWQLLTGVNAPSATCSKKGQTMATADSAEGEVVIACDPFAISMEENRRWLERVGPQLYGAVQEIRELPDGYAFRLPTEPEMLRLTAEDISYERLCCPFVRYTLEVEPHHGPFWLRMTGGDGVKAFLRMAFESANLLNEEAARAAGFSVAGRVELDSLESVLGAIDGVNKRFASAADSAQG